MEVVNGLSATTSLLRVAWDLVNAILEARGEVRNAPDHTTKLLDTVTHAQRSLRHLQSVTTSEGHQIPLWVGLDGPLTELGEELTLALEKVQSNVTSNERRQAGNQVVAAARSVLGRGASRQNKETLTIVQRLETSLASLDREVVYFTAGKVANLDFPGSLHPEHELVTRMLTLAGEVDETLSLEVAVSSTAGSWIDPSNSSPVIGIRLHSGLKRDAREGGYEVPNCTKVRFSMSVSFGHWYFYVLSYDRCASAEPRVVFPKSANNLTNVLSSDSRRGRVFPSRDKMHPGDPISLKVERSAHVPDGEEGQVSIFLVLTSTQLQKDGAHGREQITIQDIGRHMNSVEDDDLIVKHIPFDIAK